MKITYLIQSMSGFHQVNASPTGKWQVIDRNGFVGLYLEMETTELRNIKTEKTRMKRCGFLWLKKKPVNIWEFQEVTDRYYIHEDNISYTIEYDEQSCA